MTTKTRAVTYARYSSKMQREASIDDQQRNMHERARREGWGVVHDYADRAISGTDDKRPQYQAMLQAARRGEFEVLLLDDLSRLTRDSAEQERACRVLEFQRVRIVSCSDGYDSTSKARKLHRQIKGAMNEQYNDDLAERVHRGQKGQALQGRWIGGRPYGYNLRPLRDPTQRDQYGEAKHIGTVLEINKQQAKVVREVFEAFANGDSCSIIARALNARGTPSPGSTWRRETRRCSGWMSSAIRVILRNPLYTGRQRWNVSQFVRNPETKRHVRRARDQAEWVVTQNEALRVVPHSLFDRVQRRFSKLADGDVRLKAGGKARYLLSGLLKCGCCGRAYTMANGVAYSCGSVRDGACTNTARVRRDALERTILGPINEQLLNPARVKRMAKEMEAEFAKRVREAAARATEAPRELQELDARLDRLRARLRDGDPDLTTDELQGAIAKVEVKRETLQGARVEAQTSARILSLLPKAAEAYRRQIEAGLDGDPEAAHRARAVLRDLVGDVTLTPDGDALYASYRLDPRALVASQGVGTVGRDERI